jgi:hypothetical protein
MANQSVPRLTAWCVGALATILAGSVRADVVYNEMVQGDISDDRFAPTQLTLSPGSNDLFGIMSGGNKKGIDRDYFSITIPEGHVLAQLILGVYSSPDFAAFIAIQPGPVFPNDPDTVGPDDLMGWAHFGPAEKWQDLLPIMGANGQGFTPPLPAGTYTFWAQQTDDYTDYALDFVVEVPAPASAAIVMMSLGLAVRRRRATPE